MRDTVLAILLTQLPIAIACFWVAMEMRGIRRGIEELARRLEETDARTAQKDGEADDRAA